MKKSLRARAALWLADWINHRAYDMRHALHEHVRDERQRITLADKRTRGLRLYAAWSGARRQSVDHQPAAVHALLT